MHGRQAMYIHVYKLFQQTNWDYPAFKHSKAVLKWGKLIFLSTQSHNNI